MFAEAATPRTDICSRTCWHALNAGRAEGELGTCLRWLLSPVVWEGEHNSEHPESAGMNSSALCDIDKQFFLTEKEDRLWLLYTSGKGILSISFSVLILNEPLFLLVGNVWNLWFNI